MRHALAAVLTLFLTSGVALADDAMAHAGHVAESVVAGSAFTSLSPVRVLDTRTGVGGISGPVGGTIPSVVDLGTLGGGYSVAFGINNDGTVVGQAANAQGEFHAVTWNRHGRISDLGTLGGPHSTATRINANGSAMGQVATVSGGHHAARWDRHGRGTDLGTLPGGTGSNAVAIADDESVVGYADTAPDASFNVFTHAVRWDRQGRIIDLGSPGLSSMANDVNNDGTAVGETDDGATGHAVRWDRQGRAVYLEVLPGCVSSGASAINNDGIIIGGCSEANGESHAVRWDKRGRPTELATLGEESGGPYLLNENGLLAGVSTPAGEFDRYHATRWTRHGRPFDLGTLPGGPRSDARWINATGMVVGTSDTATNERHAVWWDRRGRITDLGMLPGGTRSEAYAINDNGVAVGFAFTASDELRAVLWFDPRFR